MTPGKIRFAVLYNTTHSLRSSIVDNNNEKQKKSKNTSFFNETEDVYKAQCFPIYSLLLAIGQTAVDYFSLDVEGSEYKILNTIPWHKVDIKTLTVEWDHTPEGEFAIDRLMEDNKFIKFDFMNK
ncbi:hypothetical protein DAPPUDRAFT_326665 [Daphnia pulex]|uniref:Methyltransferase FkbM domain-containing protein n=1 Tax=Daphnia pulex TaxID=6669 RepID=E9H8F3_DAPPU|nr:hypothetical protein DAPPUDRAFT_326665 [Daphnia pulex]|eukprot:EFX71992.1 hypothetical protein DAPPUDRAFT_326665 [Daphnia pulex]